MTATRGQHLIGKVLGSCVLEKLLGYGGSSEVYLAQQQASTLAPARKVAVKVFLPRHGTEEQERQDYYVRFLREARAVSKLDHENILPIYAYGEEDGRPYIVMPYMPGGTLAQYMAKRGPLSLREARWYLEQIASALDYAHEHGCVHCDVKPANILLDSDGYVMLSDFGIARDQDLDVRDQVDAEQKHEQYHDTVLGTPDYISPEQALGYPLDGRSDVYSLGVTLFFLLTRRLPFHADNPIALALQHVYDTPPLLSLLRADATPALDSVMLKALAKDPKDRYQSAGELSAAFGLASSESEKRSTFLHLAATSVSDEPIFTGPQPVFVSRPVLQAFTGKVPRTPMQRLLIISLALLFIMATISATFSFMSRHRLATITVTAVHPQTTHTPVDTKADWPMNNDYKFDQQGRYHIINRHVDGPNGVAIALYGAHSFQNFKMTVTIQAIRLSVDEDYMGVVFHVAPNESSYDLFEISPNDNACYFMRYEKNQYQHLWSGHMISSAAPVTPGDINTIAIVAQGNAFRFSINGHQVSDQPIKDNAAPLPGTLLGFYVEHQGEVAFSDFEVAAL